MAARSKAPRKAARTIEDTINRAGSVGALERLAGIGQTDDARYSFWRTYSSLPAARGLDAGVAELKRRIRSGETIKVGAV